MSLAQYFSTFRGKVIGYNRSFETPYGTKKMIYADWAATGRLYAPIEEKLKNEFGPYVGNTHTETTTTGTSMTIAYHLAHDIIKKHVNTNSDDAIITSGSGMTGVTNKFQRILGLKVPGKLDAFVKVPVELRPIVFITHMEHHSNHTSWLETIADVEIIEPNQEGLVDTNHLEELLEKYKYRKSKIAAVTACSNVTGIQTPYHQIARLMHENGGLCFVDFACSAPYVKINMHPEDPLEKLDAIYFSPHKFLGGPGSPGVLVFNAKLYFSKVPDDPGGGTVKWTNPWGELSYIDDIEAREDGGTPAFLQTIKAALCIKLKEKMGTENMLNREKEILPLLFRDLKQIDKLHILAGNIEDRLGVLSFYIDGLHYNLGVRLLNDRFGIQTRGGCSCAGTYGHYLLNISKDHSKQITDKINVGDLSAKPGWIRLSIHPIMTDSEINLILFALKELVKNFTHWQEDYRYNPETDEFDNIHARGLELKMVQNWFAEMK